MNDFTTRQRGARERNRKRERNTARANWRVVPRNICILHKISSHFQEAQVNIIYLGHLYLCVCFIVHSTHLIIEKFHNQSVGKRKFIEPREAVLLGITCILLVSVYNTTGNSNTTMPCSRTISLIFLSVIVSLSILVFAVKTGPCWLPGLSKTNGSSLQLRILSSSASELGQGLCHLLQVHLARKLELNLVQLLSFKRNKSLSAMCEIIHFIMDCITQCAFSEAAVNALF